MLSAVAAECSEAPTALSLPYRVGHGWDLHRLEEGYPLIIGGIEIPHVVGCVAHSDGLCIIFKITSPTSAHARADTQASQS
jgi:2-C-methyl-D-erythritol 2,4-cyclodiphosphate synthase